MPKEYFKDIMFEQGFQIATEIIMSVLGNSEAITTRQYAELFDEVDEEIDRYRHED